MTDQMLMVFGVLAGAVGLFAWGRPRADIVGLLVVAALMTSGVLEPTEALAGFGSPVVILLAAIFIVSAALVNTGVTQRLGELVVRVGGANETRLVALIMLLAGAIGSVLNSAAIVARIVRMRARMARLSSAASRSTIPLSYHDRRCPAKQQGSTAPTSGPCSGTSRRGSRSSRG